MDQIYCDFNEKSCNYCPLRVPKKSESECESNREHFSFSSRLTLKLTLFPLSYFPESEGTSRFSNKDRKNFFVVSRGSAFEYAANLEYLYETRMYLNTKTQYYNNHLHVGSIIPLK